MTARGGKGGKDGVREGVEKAKVVQAAPPASKAPAAAPPSFSRRFAVRDDGLYRLSHEEGKSDTFLCGPIEVLSESRDEEGRNWGLLLQWEDRDGIEHQEAFARALFAGDGAEIRSRLADGGLSLNPAPHARGSFMEWLSACSSRDRARSVTRIGWHAVAAGLTFVLPDMTFGETTERVVLQTTDREPSLFGVGGSVEDWKAQIGALCIGNSRLVFAVGCAFGAPLLGLLGEEGGGFSLKGSSRLGKSTALRVAASVCGGRPESGAGGYIRSWRSTANGIESTALASNDGLMCLDEMGQLDAREAGEIAYMLSNGQGKARANRLGSARAASRFRVLFLNTGELGLADLNREVGKVTKAGQEVRFADLPADAGQGLGLFEHLHDEDTADAFAKHLRGVTSRIYGAPLRAFLTGLIARMKQGHVDDFVTELRGRTDRLLDGWLRPYSDVSGQVRSVGYRFALVALGGELATSFGLTGWADDVAGYSAGVCFHAYLAERGTVGHREEDQAVAKLRDFLTRHGQSRFDSWVDTPAEDARQADPQAQPAGDRFRTQHRAGWRRWITEADADGISGAWRYYLTADGMAEALSSLNQRDAKQTLIKRGFLIPGRDGKFSGLVSPPGFKKVRAYEVLASIMSTDAGSQ